MEFERSRFLALAAPVVSPAIFVEGGELVGVSGSVPEKGGQPWSAAHFESLADQCAGFAPRDSSVYLKNGTLASGSLVLTHTLGTAEANDNWRFLMAQVEYGVNEYNFTAGAIVSFAWTGKVIGEATSAAWGASVRQLTPRMRVHLLIMASQGTTHRPAVAELISHATTPTDFVCTITGLTGAVGSQFLVGPGNDRFTSLLTEFDPIEVQMRDQALVSSAAALEANADPAKLQQRMAPEPVGLVSRVRSFFRGA